MTFQEMAKRFYPFILYLRASCSTDSYSERCSDSQSGKNENKKIALWDSNTKARAKAGLSLFSQQTDYHNKKEKKECLSSKLTTTIKKNRNNIGMSGG